MKNSNRFINENWAWPPTLKGQLELYNELNNKIKKCLSRKKAYDELINDKKNTNDNYKLDFKEQFRLYCIVNDLIKKNSDDHTYLGIDLLELRERLESVYKGVSDYVKLYDELRSLREYSSRILSEHITFNIFYNEYFNERCIDRHFFMRLDEELKCIYCGATTKDYQLSEEELDFLTLCAESQGILLKEATEKDLPLLQVLMEKQDYYRSLRKPLDSFNEETDDYLAEAEEQWLSDEAEISDLRRQIRKAHLLDSQTYNDKDIVVRNPKYLSDEKSKELLLEVEKELEKVKTVDSNFKDLMIEECKTARYEILILSGGHIPSLFEQAQNEDDKTALIKAYYNISSQEFRINSEYFDSDANAIFYDCITANPEINKRILQMKSRR